MVAVPGRDTPSSPPMTQSIGDELQKSVAMMTALAGDAALVERIGRAATLCVDALRAGGKILFIGNGGSAADAQHLAGELVGRFSYDRPGLPAFALTADSAV